MIISEPVQTAPWFHLATGALFTEIGVQASLMGLYSPPVLTAAWPAPLPPQTIIKDPVQIPVVYALEVGALVVEVATQVLVEGLYLPPVFIPPPPIYPPQTIIVEPVQTTAL
jgi:hypothetical protein